MIVIHLRIKFIGCKFVVQFQRNMFFEYKKNNNKPKKLPNPQPSHFLHTIKSINNIDFISDSED